MVLCLLEKVGDYTLLYCVATKKEDPIMKTIFVNHANSILQLGDYCYNELVKEFEEHIIDVSLPKIATFKPFLDREIPSLQIYEALRQDKMIKIVNFNRSLNTTSKLRLIVDNKHDKKL